MTGEEWHRARSACRVSFERYTAFIERHAGEAFGDCQYRFPVGIKECRDRYPSIFGG